MIMVSSRWRKTQLTIRQWTCTKKRVRAKSFDRKRITSLRATIANPCLVQQLPKRRPQMRVRKLGSRCRPLHPVKDKSHLCSQAHPLGLPEDAPRGCQAASESTSDLG
jgi:hypothetical protein